MNVLTQLNAGRVITAQNAKCVHSDAALKALAQNSPKRDIAALDYLLGITHDHSQCVKTRLTIT